MLVAVGVNIIHSSELKEAVVQPSVDSFVIETDKNSVVQKTQDCELRRAPFSTFKIVLSVMGFDAGILTNKDLPKWSFKEEYLNDFPSFCNRESAIRHKWLGEHTPETFMKNSVLWFSHQITKTLGKEKFQNYINKFNYGNKDVSGTPGKDDGLLIAWLGTSLKISPQEQVDFLKKLLSNKLGVSKEAHEKTREVMNRQEEWNGWKLFGKTGGGTWPTGWFVGWIEKGDQKIIFAQYVEFQDSSLSGIGRLAKDIVKEKILAWMKSSQ
jgi:beta-lactamase class D